MTPSDVAGLFMTHADDGVRLTLSSGDYVDVPNPGDARVAGGVIYIDPQLASNRIYAEGKVRYVSVVNVALIQPLPSQSPPSSN